MIPSKLGLPTDLNHIEKLLISLNRTFIKCITLYGSPQKELKGHVISLKHDAPDTLINVLPNLNVRELLNVVLLEPLVTY